MPTTSRKWVLRSHFSGAPKREDLEIVTEELPDLKDGEFLCEAKWLSVDPYMRTFSARLSLGSTMMGAQVAKVIESKSSKYEVGDWITCGAGWVSHFILDEGNQQVGKQDPELYKGRESTALGVLGMPGATAHIAFLNINRPKEGETLVVNGAAGAVGSLVGQIAKIKGCRVVGFVGSDEKVEYCKSLGFDECLNYKTMGPIPDALKKTCPKGIDMFFDNVGGEWFESVLAEMNDFGRVTVCGAISQYNNKDPPKGTRYISGLILAKTLKIEGFAVFSKLSEWPESFKCLSKWIAEGKLKYKESVTEGFDNMFTAFAGLFTGANTGKAVVKA